MGLRLSPAGIHPKGMVDELDEPRAMRVGLFAALVVLLAATTFDNVSETVGSSSFLSSTNLDALPPMVSNSFFLLAFSLLFFAPFVVSVAIARYWVGARMGVVDTARRFGWSLIPIAIAYVLAHNAPLLILASHCCFVSSRIRLEPGGTCSELLTCSTDSLPRPKPCGSSRSG